MALSTSRVSLLLSCVIVLIMKFAMAAASVPSFTLTGPYAVTTIPSISCFSIGPNGQLTFCNDTIPPTTVETLSQAPTSTQYHTTFSNKLSVVVGDSAVPTVQSGQSSEGWTQASSMPTATSHTLSLTINTWIISKPLTSPTSTTESMPDISTPGSTSTMTLTSNRSASPTSSSSEPTTSGAIVTATPKSASHKSFNIPNVLLLLTFAFMFFSAVSAWEGDPYATTISLQETATETLPCTTSVTMDHMTPEISILTESGTPTLGNHLTPHVPNEITPGTLEPASTSTDITTHTSETVVISQTSTPSSPSNLLPTSETVVASHTSIPATTSNLQPTSSTLTSPTTSPTMTSASAKSFKTPNIFLVFTFLAMVFFASAHYDPVTTTPSGETTPTQTVSCSMDSPLGCGESGRPAGQDASWIAQPNMPTLPPIAIPTSTPTEFSANDILSILSSIASQFYATHNSTSSMSSHPTTSTAIPTSTPKSSAASLKTPGIFRLLASLGSFFSSVAAQTTPENPLAVITAIGDLPCSAGETDCSMPVSTLSLTLSATETMGTASYPVATPTSAQDHPIKTPPGTPRGAAIGLDAVKSFLDAVFIAGTLAILLTLSPGVLVGLF